MMRATKFAPILCIVSLVLMAACGDDHHTTTRTLTSVALAATSLTPPLGNTVQMTATGTYSDGSTQTATGVAWTSSDTTVATIDANGVVTTRKQGTATITASVGGVSKTITITVGPPTLASVTISPSNPSVTAGTKQSFIASGTLTDGSPSGSISITWASSTPSVATIDGSGMASTIGAGTTTITATSGSLSDSTTLTVTAPPHTVTYKGNGNTDGTVPTDANTYTQGQTVTVLGEGNLVRAGYSFQGWNTQADGLGTNYIAGSTFSMGSTDLRLYAKWVFSHPGSVDTTFGTNGFASANVGGFETNINAMAVQADGKVIVGGFYGAMAGSADGFFVARFMSDGSLDTTFGPGNSGYVTTRIGDGGGANAVAIQPADGKIVVAGESNRGLTVARYNTDGSLDSTFGDGSGYVLMNYCGTPLLQTSGSGVAVQSNGQIVVTGVYQRELTDQSILLARYNSDGSADSSFGSCGIVTTAAGQQETGGAIVIQNNGQIVITSLRHIMMPSPNGGLYSLVARYNVSDGSLDPSFGANGIVVTSFLYGYRNPPGLAIQQDGRIVLAGEVIGGGTAEEFAVERHNTDGTLDTTFGSGKGYVASTKRDPSFARAVAIQNDGKIVAGGKITYQETWPGGPWSWLLARYNTDGSLDTTFGSLGIGGEVITNVGGRMTALAIQSDGKILACGGSTVVRYWP